VITCRVVVLEAASPATDRIRISCVCYGMSANHHSVVLIRQCTLPSCWSPPPMFRGWLRCAPPQHTSAHITIRQEIPGISPKRIRPCPIVPWKSQSQQFYHFQTY